MLYVATGPFTAPAWNSLITDLIGTDQHPAIGFGSLFLVAAAARMTPLPGRPIYRLTEKVSSFIVLSYCTNGMDVPVASLTVYQRSDI